MLVCRMPDYLDPESFFMHFSVYFLCVLQVDCVSLLAHTPAASEVKLTSVFQRADALQPCVLLLRNLHFLLRTRGGAEEEGSRVLATLCQLLQGTSCRFAEDLLPPSVGEQLHIT